jgi:hypothetical protein
LPLTVAWHIWLAVDPEAALWMADSLDRGASVIENPAPPWMVILPVTFAWFRARCPPFTDIAEVPPP